MSQLKLERLNGILEKELEDMGYYEDLKKYKVPIDKKLADYFRDKKRWSEKMKNICNYTLDDYDYDYDGKKFWDWREDWLHENKWYAQQSHENQEGGGFTALLGTYLNPSDIAWMIDDWLAEKQKDAEVIQKKKDETKPKLVPVIEELEKLINGKYWKDWNRRDYGKLPTEEIGKVIEKLMETNRKAFTLKITLGE